MQKREGEEVLLLDERNGTRHAKLGEEEVRRIVAAEEEEEEHTNTRPREFV